MNLQDRVNFQKLVHAGEDEENNDNDIQACGMDPYASGTSKLDQEDDNHPANSSPAMHKDMKSAGFKYKGSRSNGSTVTHVYSHPSANISDHAETVAKKQSL